MIDSVEKRLSFSICMDELQKVKSLSNVVVGHNTLPPRTLLVPLLLKFDKY